MNNVVAQTQLEKVWVSTVEISSLTRTMDTLIEAIVPEGYDRPGLKTRATEFRYETMVFQSEGKGASDWEELDCERYNSLEEAKAGHVEVVNRWLDKEEIS